MTDQEISNTKKIIGHHFSAERNKQRLTDVDKNQELVTYLGSALTIIECNVKADLKRLNNGELIEAIIPETK